VQVSKKIQWLITLPFGENGDSLIWTKSSDPKKEIKQAKYDLLLDLINAHRGISECSQCTKKRRIMNGVDYCIGCVLTGLG
jgi:hypothetical protein